MKVFKWSPAFNPFEETPIVPVWISLPFLPVHFFNWATLFSIAKAFGNPLKTDEPTANLTRPSVGRICIEVDVSKSLPNRIWLVDDKEGFWQEVVFENPPQFCLHCKLLGHDESSCYSKFPELRPAAIRIEATRSSKLIKGQDSKIGSEPSKGKQKSVWVHKPIITESANLIPEPHCSVIPAATWAATASLGVALTPFAQKKGL